MSAAVGWALLGWTLSSFGIGLTWVGAVAVARRHPGHSGQLAQVRRIPTAWR
jgi:type IV secretory pathway TrbD component